MIIFENDDDAYLSWIHMNPKGFVANAIRNANGAEQPYVLHRATCRNTIAEEIPNFEATIYIRLCSLDRQEIDELAQQQSPDFKDCGDCKP
ncbi:MAG: hypothetical protein GC204_12025 [Chloroflexi bacterium]|nr:hypothetical protein [Chloroflexota bacterium]